MLSSIACMSRARTFCPHVLLLQELHRSFGLARDLTLAILLNFMVGYNHGTAMQWTQAQRNRECCEGCDTGCLQWVLLLVTVVRRAAAL